VAKVIRATNEHDPEAPSWALGRRRLRWIPWIQRRDGSLIFGIVLVHAPEALSLQAASLSSAQRSRQWLIVSDLL